ncbi:MAG: hypothetical protein ABF242_06955 [Flavobacteriales bacterium]
MTEKKRSLLRFIWVLPVGVMALTSVLKIVKAAPLVENFEKLDGVQWMIPFGIIQLVSTILFLIPKTRRIGFFLLMGYLGGIIATKALHEVNNIGVILTVLLWIGMYFEDRSLFIKSEKI